MKSCIRHCVECPRCRTRYLLGYSPYSNGSSLLPLGKGLAEEWALYCVCGARPSRWHWTDLKKYAVSGRAHNRGYGAPDEIVWDSRNNGHDGNSLAQL